MLADILRAFNISRGSSPRRAWTAVLTFAIALKTPEVSIEILRILQDAEISPAVARR